MKRFLSLLATGALALGLSTSASAQIYRALGAGALTLDDNHGNTLTIQTPQYLSTAWDEWSSEGFPNIWTLPVPPVGGATPGFIYQGPLTGSVLPDIAYWIPPGKTSISGSGNVGGFTGAWDYATELQLGIMTNPMTTTGDMIYSNPGATPVRLGIGTTGQFLQVSGGLPTWQTTLGVANGGTGDATLAQHGVLLGNAANPLNVTAVGATGTVLIGNTGADPSWTALSSIAVTSITGTANEVTATPSTGAVTLSLPAVLIAPGTFEATTSIQDAGLTTAGIVTNTVNGTLGTVAIVPVANGGTGDVTVAQHGVVVGNAANPLNATAVGATNTVLHGNTGADPTFSAITAGDITPGADNTFLTTNNGGVVGFNALDVDGTTLTGDGSHTALTISPTYIGQTSITTLGTIGTGTWAGTTIAVAHGGTGDVTVAQHGVVIGNAANPLNATAVGATNTVLHGNTGADPTFSAITAGDITPGADNTFLTTNNGGVVGFNALDVDGTTLTGDGSHTALAISPTYIGQTSITTLGTIGTGTWAGTTIAVAHGGTGDVTVAQHGVVIGNAANPLNATAVGATNTVLHGNTGADPTFSAITAGDITPGADNTFLTTNNTGVVGFNALDVDGTTLTGDGSHTALAISPTYIGQTSITTLGTIGTGTWAGTTVAVAHGGTGDVTVAQHGVVVGNAANPLNATAVGATNTVLHGNTGADPTFSAITAGDITPGADNTFLTTNNGGVVGFNALDVDGTTLTGDGSHTALAISPTYIGQTSITTLGTIGTGTWAGTTIAVAHGGTGDVTVAQHGVVIGNAANPLNATAVGATNTVLHGNTGADPTFSAITAGDITPGADNTFLTTNNTGVVGFTALDVDGTTLTGDGSHTALAISPTYIGQTSITTLGTIGTGTWAGTTVAVAHGGTGDVTVAQHGVVVGNAANPLNATAVGATHTVLHGNTGADPTFSAITAGDITPGADNTFLTTNNAGVVGFNALDVDGTTLTGDGSHTALAISPTYIGQTSITTLGTIGTGTWAGTTIAVAHGGTGDVTVAQHGVVIGNAANPLNATAVGATNTVLHGNTGADPTFSAITAGDITPGADNTFLTTNNGGVVGFNALDVDGTTLTGDGSHTALAISPTYIGQTSITTLGTIGTGTWAGTTIAVAHGGTGDVTVAQHGVVIGNAANPLNATAVGATNTVLHGNTALTQRSARSQPEILHRARTIHF